MVDEASNELDRILAVLLRLELMRVPSEILRRKKGERARLAELMGRSGSATYNVESRHTKSTG